MNSQYPYTPQNEQPPYYNQSFANPPTEKNPARGMAIAALITAIASTVLSCCTCGLSIIGLIVAIVLANAWAGSFNQTVSELCYRTYDFGPGGISE